jgi:hypothetical protein
MLYSMSNYVYWLALYAVYGTLLPDYTAIFSICKNKSHTQEGY